MGIQINGIDISHWQGSINATQVCNEQGFIILKVSQKKTVDPNFEKYYAGISGRIPVGAYIYVVSKDATAAKAEAETAIKALKGKNLPLGVWLDMEDNSIKNLGKAKLSEIIYTESSLLQNAGFKVGIYCNNDWYNKKLDSQNLADSYPFWVARYPKLDDGTIKTSLSPEGKKGVKIWQYSSKGKVAGISGNVDKNVCFNLLYNIFGSGSASSSSNFNGVLPTLPSRGYFIKGDKGTEVKRLQYFLNYLYGPILVEDGICGTLTIRTVVHFQEKYGLVADGKFGKASLNKAKEIVG